MEIDRIARNTNGEIGIFSRVVISLNKHFAVHNIDVQVDYDDAGSIGKRYRRQDEIGTPFSITYDFDSKEDGCVTVRDRDTMEQTRIPVSGLVKYIEERLEF